MAIKVGELVGGPGQFEQTLDLGDHVIKIMDSLVRVDFDDIQGEVEEAGPKVAYIGTLSARVVRMAKVARLTARHYEAKLAKDVRAAAKARGDRITDQMVKEEVRADETAYTARLEHLKVQEAASILENLKFTLGRIQQSVGQSYVGLLMAERGAQSEPEYFTDAGARQPRTPAKRRPVR